MKRKKFIVITCGLMILQVLVTITLSASITYGVEHSKAPQGLMVWGTNLSGLSLEEAYAHLVLQIPQEVYYKDTTYKLKTPQSQKRLWDELKKIYVPTSKIWFINALDYIKGMKPTQLYPERLDSKEVLPQLETIANKINQGGRPASLSLKDGKVSVFSDSPRVKVDIQSSLKQLNQSSSSQPVPLVVQLLSVHPDAEDLQNVQDKLGDYTTYFNPNIFGRTNNVRHAASAINGRIIKPGADFSFNQAVGKRDEETGYLPAFVFVDKKVVIDSGGGICQDSSTLYQAVKQAHLQVLERNTHSLPVTYVPKGQDATVAYGLLDFRFRNNTKGYLYIDARTGSNWVRIQIYGMADPEHPRLTKADGFPMKPSGDGELK